VDRTEHRLPLLQITTSYFCAGVEVSGRAAPIIRYLKGRSEKEITEYCKRKGWKVEIVS